MPWSQTSPMDQKTQFVANVLRGTVSLSELCTQYGISRKTGYKWLLRYRAQGPAGLADRSRRPARCPHATPPAITTALVEARRRHPSFQARSSSPCCTGSTRRGPGPPARP